MDLGGREIFEVDMDSRYYSFFFLFIYWVCGYGWEMEV